MFIVNFDLQYSQYFVLKWYYTFYTMMEKYFNPEIDVKKSK
jgi:hypothetical protein